MHFIRDHVGNLVFSVVSVKGGTRNIQRFFAHYKYTKISMDVQQYVYWLTLLPRSPLHKAETAES